MDTFEALKAARQFDSVPMEVDVEIDRLVMSFRDIVELQEGMVLRTSKKCGAPLDVRVGGAVVAQGEALARGGRAAIRLSSAKKK